jgi:UDP-N-acetylglucosamine 2-epimerase (non-hydrolysing)
MALQEEKNRIIVDHISDFLFAPTAISKQNLVNEKVQGKIFVVGNTIMDAIKIVLDQDKSKNIHNSIDNPNHHRKFILVTLHRTENLLNKVFLEDFFLSLKESNFSYMFPIHPHTLKQIKKFGLEHVFQNEKIEFIPPLGYSDFLNLLKKCRFVITDSGGIQEEITSNLINKQAIIVRSTTERPDSFISVHSLLLGNFSRKKLTDLIKNLHEMVECNENIKLTSNPYGMGDSAKKIVGIIEQLHKIPI